MSNVSGTIKSIQDIMRKDVGVDGDAQRISQLVWMFFLKIYDDREAEIELLEEDYTSPLPEGLRWRNWAADAEGMTGDALSQFVNEQLFPTLKEKLVVEGPHGKRAQVIRNVFEDAYNYMKSGTLIRQVINKISEINFNNTDDRHTFGSIYEQILKDLQSAGNAGEFYTPRAVTQFIVNRVDPQLAETVLDPACGTGGFLVCAIDHKRRNYVKSAEDEETLIASIHGVEKKALPHMLCTTNMILHGIDTPTNIRHDNTLSRPYRDYGEKDRVQVIVTNPPFGGTEEDGIENNFPANYRTRETADLFMALIVKLLKNHGRAAVVLPDGFLFGEGMKTRLKQELLEKCHLHTIVRLPNGVFNPYTGIKTNILFFTKKPESEQPATQHVWFYEHPYPEGVVSYNKSKPMRFEEFQKEIDWWGSENNGFKSRKETEHAWKVSIEEIAALNYNLDISNPHVGKLVNHDPEQLLAEYNLQQMEIRTVCDQLKSILATALAGNQVVSTPKRLIIENLEIWSSAIKAKSSAGRASRKKEELYGIKKLRDFILELAVRGLLMPQDSNDEPASELLTKIASAEAQLVKSGKIRSRKAFSKINESEKSFLIPGSWVWARLGNLGFTQTGGTPSTSNTEYFGDEIPFIKPADIMDGCVDYQNEGLSSIGSEKLGRVAPAGSVLMVCIGTIGKCAGIDRDCTFNQQINSVSPYLEISAYLYRAVSAPFFQSQAWEKSSSTTIAILNKGNWENIPLPLPPLAEQQRIVSKVDELMVLCDRLETSIQICQTTQLSLADSLVEAAIH